MRIFSEALTPGANPTLVNAIGNENDSPSRELARFAQEIGDRYVPDFHGELIFRADRFLRGGDHESFNAAGFPAIRFTEPVETFRTSIRPCAPKTASNTATCRSSWTSTIWRGSPVTTSRFWRRWRWAPDVPRQRSILTRKLDNETQLTWTAGPRRGDL